MIRTSQVAACTADADIRTATRPKTTLKRIVVADEGGRFGGFYAGRRVSLA